ncbi:beta strand repeat-containing protein [Inquilinus sp.]|jgi:Ca2+-binding RTX toxin-like protein|uniref:beta strand repeat-containing protein n=1 Tax=Inquilinus sp. TaxID=1932117 RepID=UPI003783E882
MARIDGTEGNDELSGTDADDEIYGYGGDDQLYGGRGGDDLLSGGDGFDTFDGGDGADTLDGGTGDDLVYYSYNHWPVTVNLATGTASGGEANGDVLISIERIIGSRYGDTLIGSDGNDRLNGQAGNDILRGGGGADTLDGEDGIDTVIYSDSAAGVTVNLAAGTGSGGTAEGDRFHHIEIVEGSAYADTLIGNDAANSFRGNNGDDVLKGAGGDDTLDGGVGADTLDGGDGSDIADYSNSTAGVSVNLAAGTVSDGTATGDTLISIEGIIGSSYADTLTGNAAANTFRGGAGADHLDGGGGFDTADYADSTTGVSVNLAAGTVSGGTAAGDTLISIEGIIGSAYADTLTGNAAANIFRGGAGNDILRGGTGNDILTGGAGADTLDGGNGNDLISYADSTKGVTVNLASGIGSSGTAFGDTLTSIELVTGSAYADTLVGNDVANTFRGGAGADHLDGGGGFDIADYADSTTGVSVNLATGTGSGGAADGDTLVSIEAVTGSAYADALVGSGVANTLDGGNGNDLASYVDSTTGVTVNLVTGTGSGGTATGDTLVSIEAVTGSAYADTLIGNAAANTLRGGAGADRLDGGASFDTADYADSTVGVTVNLATGTGSSGTAYGDTLVSIEAVTGSAYADALVGSDAANWLFGEAGDDVLRGLGGKDLLRGDAGADRFVFAALSDSAPGFANADQIADFWQVQADQIDLSQIDADTGLAGNQAFSFIGAAAYTGVAGQLRWVVSGDDVVIGGDVNGDSVSDFNIVLWHRADFIRLQASDFVL